MKRLTAERVNGIKRGYWSNAGKEDLVQALGKYEDTGCSPKEVRDLLFQYSWEDAKYSTPAKRGYYWVTIQHGEQRIVMRVLFDLEWRLVWPDRVVAWMPTEQKPKPYQGEKGESLWTGRV